MINRKICVSATFILVGLELLTVSILLFVFGDNFIQSNVDQQCELHQGTRIYDTWRTPPVPYKISFYFFDIVDQEFINTTKTPVVQERGPFVYQEVRTKVDVLTHDNGTISYRELRSYEFDLDSSAEPNTTKITTMNIVYMTFVNYFETENVSFVVKDIVTQLLQGLAHPITTHSVAELLWGYSDKILEGLQELAPDLVPSTIVSIFNASVGDAGLSTFLINNGIDVFKNESNRLKKAGNIEGFNGRPNVLSWSNESANMINGTDSTIWHSGATKDDQVYIFTPDLCRSLYLEYAENRQNTFDIENLRFTLPIDVFANTSENEGFCLNTTNFHDHTTRIQCLPSGLMSLKSCLKPSGSDAMPIPLPIIASSPHFLGADASVQSAVRGLQPDAKKHQSFMDIEPITGTVMNGSRRMQINVNVVNSSEIPEIAHVTPFVFPLLWLDEHAEIDQKNADDFRSTVIIPMRGLRAAKYASLSFGIAILVISTIIILVACFKNKSSDQEYLITK